MRLSSRPGPTLLAAVILAGLPFASWAQPAPTANPRSVHDQVLVLDSHVDVLLADTPRRYYAPNGGSRASLTELDAGGVDAIVFAIAVGPGPETPAGYAAAHSEAEAKLAAVQSFIANSGGRLEQARTADDIERIHRSGRIAVLLGFQNARILGEDLSAFDRFHEAGVRVAALNHAGHNAFSDSSRPQTSDEIERHRGLSPLGRQAIRRFNDLGVLIDVSQLSTAALLQTLQLTRAPVVATHSNVRALVDNTRNLSDAELDAIKANGGIVQLTPFSAYLHNPTDVEQARVGTLRRQFGLSPDGALSDAAALPEAERNRFYDALQAATPRATLSEYVDHIEYVIRRLGVEHVGIGSDFDHGAGIVGFNTEGEAANVTAELVRRGYSQDQIALIWGGNFLRVLRATEAAAIRT